MGLKVISLDRNLATIYSWWEANMDQGFSKLASLHAELKEQARQHIQIIDRFSGKYSFLSNFYMCEVVFEGKTYPSTEHAYQAAKALDPTLRYQFTVGHSLTPGQAKRLGQKLPLRADWEDVKIDVMRYILVSKFANPELRAKLRETGDAYLEEGNNWGDHFWGVDGYGWNHLGRLLMRIRTILL